MSTPLTVDGKEFLVQAIRTASITNDLYLRFYYEEDNQPPSSNLQQVSYYSPVQSGGNAYCNISGDVVKTLLQLGKVTQVDLEHTDGTVLASETILAGTADFPNGGSYIVEGFKITVA